MWRRLFNIAAVLLVVASAALLLPFGVGRSWFGLRPVAIGRHQLFGNWYFQVYDTRQSGYIALSVFHDWPTPNVGPPLAPNLSYTPAALAWYDRQPTGSHVRKLGFSYDHDTYFERNATRSLVAMGRYVRVGVPLWAAGAVWLLLIPFAVVIRRRVWRRWVVSDRLRRGLCVDCGYDLRVTPDRCPECGTLPKPPHHPPMQRTGAAGKVSIVRTLLGRGAGR